MLTDVALTAVIPASDLERAKRFYRDTLGLKLTKDAGEALAFEAGGVLFTVYSTPSGGQAAHTVAGWNVADLVQGQRREHPGSGSGDVTA
jgi:catechol 2,3-dioxygenase-like lactoylglutathione lyase family enzyme